MSSTICLHKTMLAKEMPPSSEVSMRSRSALTVLSHDDLSRPRGRLQKSPGPSATRRLRMSEPSSIQATWPRRETPSLNDCGQRLRTASSLNFHVGDEIRPPDVAYMPKTFPARGINFPFFTLRHCPCLRSVNKHWNQVWVVQCGVLS